MQGKTYRVDNILDRIYRCRYSRGMAKVKLTVMGYRCERCAHEWIPRDDQPPRVCPKCKSPYWDRPRQKSRN